MINPPDKCIQCDGELSIGFILDQTIGGNKSAEWIAGEPETSMWSGVKVTGKERHFVKAYRCNQCGRLEFYA